MRRAAGLALLLFAVACAELGAPRVEQAVLFEIAARIAVRFGDEASSGNLSWRHSADGDELLITSPMGVGVARIVRAGDEVILTAHDGGEHRASDAEELTERVLGFRVPLAGLTDWVRARVSPGPSRARRDEGGRLVELEQNGWRVEYLAYGDGAAQPSALPTRMRLMYPGLELRIAISEWR